MLTSKDKGSIMTTQNKQIFNDQDVADLMSELEVVLEMLDPYYSQNGGGKTAQNLLARLQEKKMEHTPFVANITTVFSCLICGHDFSHSANGKALCKSGQQGAVMKHLTDAHNIVGKERRQYVKHPVIVEKEFKNRNEYLNFRNANVHLV